MADIQRPIKTFGTRKYASERAAAPGNKAPILSAELDLDLDTVYNAWNTGVGIGDIAAGAVGPAEIAAGAVTNAKLGANAVTTDKILDGTIIAGDLATDSVTAVKILAGAVTNPKLGAGAVTVDKMAAGASAYSSGKHRRQGENVDISSRTEAGYLSVANISARSTTAFPLGFLVIRAYVYGQFSAPSADATLGIRLNRDATNIQVHFRKGQGNNAMWSIYYDDIISVPDANPHAYSIDVYSTDAFATVQGGSLVLMAPA